MIEERPMVVGSADLETLMLRFQVSVKDGKKFYGLKDGRVFEKVPEEVWLLSDCYVANMDLAYEWESFTTKGDIELSVPYKKKKTGNTILVDNKIE